MEGNAILQLPQRRFVSRSIVFDHCVLKATLLRSTTVNYSFWENLSCTAEVRAFNRLHQKG